MLKLIDKMLDEKITHWCSMSIEVNMTRILTNVSPGGQLGRGHGLAERLLL